MKTPQLICNGHTDTLKPRELFETIAGKPGIRRRLQDSNTKPYVTLKTTEAFFSVLAKVIFWSTFDMYLKCLSHNIHMIGFFEIECDSAYKVLGCLLDGRSEDFAFVTRFDL